MLEAKLGNHFTAAILIELSDGFLETAEQLCDVLSVFSESVRKKTEKYTLFLNVSFVVLYYKHASHSNCD